MATSKPTSTPEPKFWAGGHRWGKESRKADFIAGNFWEHGYAPDATDAAARTTWQRFRRIEIGDWFAIKGYGGKHQLRIWYVGRVVAKDEANARLELQPAPDAHLFRDRAPPGPSWFDTLVDCNEPSVARAVFPDAFKALQPGATMIKSSSVMPLPSPNTIFYGPPGTGKTYEARGRMEAYRISPTDPAQTAPPKIPPIPDLDSLRWVDVIALALHTFGRPVTVPELEDHPYVLERHAKRNVTTPLNNFLWRNLQDHTIEESKTVHATGKRPPHLFDKDNEKRWFLATKLPDELAALIPAKATHLKPSAQENFLFTTFHQSYSYEDFVEGIRPRLLVDGDDLSPIGYMLEDGVFKQAVYRALALTPFRGSIAEFCSLSPEARKQHLDGAPRFALFIDEINRGNVSRVFGELITLIEPDKRLGAEHELIVTLPNSRKKFGVPNNLDIIATMNSADRSVEALDTALRRRFAFVEVRPDPKLLDFEFEGGIHAGKLLTAINDRIHRLYDRDHQIGHAYFIDSPRTLAALRQIFAVRILPLLQEYFFGDWTKIGLVLGDRWVRVRGGADAKFANFPHESADDYDDRVIYELADPTDANACKAEDFRAIYKP